MRPLVQVQPGPPHRDWPAGTLAGGLHSMAVASV